MMTTLVLIMSGILIGAGVSVIWRDVQKSRRRAFVLNRDASPNRAEPDVEITISRRAETARQPAAAQPARAAAQAPATGPLTSALAAVTATAVAADDEARAVEDVAPRSPLEQQWSSLQLPIASAVTKVNEVMAPVRVTIGPPEEPNWGYKNRSFGAYRRIQLDDENVAWLRLELSIDGMLRASVKALQDDRTDLNAASEAPAEHMSETGAGDLLSQCLKPLVSYAAHARRALDNDKSERASGGVDALVAAAVSASNGALAQARARLLPLAAASPEGDMQPHRMTLCVEVNGEDVARMHIERLPREIEVAVGVRDARLIDLGRRRRIPLEGMTTHALAELIASCAWPTIARFRESRRPV